MSSNQNADAKMAAQEAAAEARAQRSDARAAARHSASVDPAKGYGMTNGSATGGGLAFHGNHGEPISAGAYLDGISGGSAGTKDLAKLLSTSGTADDKKIAASIGNMSIEQAQKAYPWLFQ